VLADILRLLELESEDLHDEAALIDALASVPPPRSPGSLLQQLVSFGVTADDVVVDVGCGHGQHAQQIASTTGCTVFGLDLSALRAAETRARHGEPGRVHSARAMAEALPLRRASASFIWCRDMLYNVDLPRTLRECRSVLTSGGRMVVYHTFATELLEPAERERLFGAFSVVNTDPAYFETCATEASFAVEERDVIGSEWREWSEADGSRKTSESLLRAARLLRGGDALRERMGDRGYEFALNDQLWGIYQMIGKLRPTVYVLRAA
jgi:SAM-dependent methyltransferase